MSSKTAQCDKCNTTGLCVPRDQRLLCQSCLAGSILQHKSPVFEPPTPTYKNTPPGYSPTGSTVDVSTQRYARWRCDTCKSDWFTGYVEVDTFSPKKTTCHHQEFLLGVFDGCCQKSFYERSRSTSQPTTTLPTYTPYTFPNNHQLLDPKTYGNDNDCQICQATGGHPIAESWQTRWLAEQVHDFLSVQRHFNANPGFMIGVAIQNGGNGAYIAFSNNNLDLPSMLSEFKVFNPSGSKFNLRYYTRNSGVDISRCRGGASVSQIAQALSNVGSSSGNNRDTSSCAASKIAKKGIGSSDDLATWCMTEMTYGTIEGQQYVDGQAAPSCGGCKRFLPTLLCPYLYS